MCEEEKGGALGPRVHALAKSQAVAKASEGPVKLLWIDGILSSDQLYNLHAYLFIHRVQQTDRYCVISFSGCVDGMRLREFIDPNVFVLQLDADCTNLEINFNPTQTQVAALRRLRETILRLNFKYIV